MIKASDEAAQAGTTNRSSGRLRVLAVSIVLVYAILICLPNAPGPINIGLDGSWMMGLNLAHANHLASGTDIIFTYGPIAHLFYPYPGYVSSRVVFWFWIALWLLEAIALTRLTFCLGFNSRAVYVLFSLIALIVLTFTYPPDCLTILTISCGLLAFLADSRYWFVDFLLFGLVAALSLLAKQNTGIEALLLFYICLLYLIVRNGAPTTIARSQLIILALFPFLIVSIYYGIARQGFHVISSYARNSMELVDGYSIGMAIGGPAWQFLLALVTIGVLFIGVPLLAESRRSFFFAFTPAAVIAFLSFKHAMVRQDIHAVWFQAEIIGASMFFLVAARSRRDQRLVLAFQTLTLTGAILIQNELFPVQLQLADQRLTLASARNSFGQFMSWNVWWNQVDQTNHLALKPAILPQAFTRKIRNGTVEALGFSVDSIVANGWKWQPRPVFQTYAAYTPRLDLINAAHVDSAKAADYSLLYWAGVDGHHLFFEDPASWRETLNWYDLALIDGDRALLKRRESARFTALVPFGSTSAKWDQAIQLPVTDDILVMQAEIDRSLTGSLRKFLYRQTPVFVHATYHSGRSYRYRAVPENLRNGAIVNPLPESMATFPALMGQHLNFADRVQSIQIETAMPGDFRPTIPLRWSRLPLRSDENARMNAIAQSRLLSLTPLWKPGQPMPSPSGTELSASGAGLVVRPTTIDPQLLFRVGPALGRSKTIVIRARFERSDYIDVFFGKQVDGRGLRGYIPDPGTWYDVFFNVDMNPFWIDEAGTTLRFDPASEMGIGSKIEIAGVWGSELALPAGSLPVEFHPVAQAIGESPRHSSEKRKRNE